MGEAGQEKLAQATVLLVGLGALGSHIADTLVRAGVGCLHLLDRDVVELSNLPRQVLYDEADAAQGLPKATAAAAHLRRSNSQVRLLPLVEDFRPKVMAQLQPKPDLILDGTDNFPTRYLCNDLALQAGIPWIYGGAVGAKGSAMAVLPGQTPCLRCLLPQAPTQTETCENVGVFAPAVAMVAAFQVAQALKILCGQEAAVARGVFCVDAWQQRSELRLGQQQPSPHCPSCSRQEYPSLDLDWHGTSLLCGRDAVQVQPIGESPLDLAQLAQQLQDVVEDCQLSPLLLRFTVEGCRFTVFPGGRALVVGTQEPSRARILYDRYIGA